MKKMLSILIAAGLILSVGCSSESSSSVNLTKPVAVSQTKYKEERAEKPQGFGSLLDMAYVSGFGTRVLWEAGGIICYADYSEEMKPSQPVELFSVDDCYQSIASIVTDGTMYVLLIRGTFTGEPTDEEYFKNGVYSFEIRSYSADGSELSIVEIPDFGEYFTPYKAPLTFFCRYGDGWIIGNQDGRWLISEDGSIADSNEDGMTFESYGIGSDGEYIHAKDTEFCYVNGKDLRDPAEMHEYGEFLRLNGGIFTGADGYKAFFVMQDGVFGLTDDDKLTEVLDFIDSRLYVAEIYSLAYVGKGKFALYGADDQGTYFSLLTVRPDDYVENRQKVEVGFLSPNTDWSKNHSEMITKYNKKNERFEADLRYFTNGIEGVSTDILSGNGPDVIVYDSRRDMTRLYNLGALADMNELSEQYGGFNEDDILDNVVEAYKYKDGLYMMSQTISMPLLIGKKKYFPNGNVTLDEFIDIASNMPEDMTLGGDMIFAPEIVLDCFVTGDLSAWVDIDNAECCFDSPDFIKLLEFTQSAKIGQQRDMTEFYATATDEEKVIYSTERRHEVANEKALINSSYIHRIADLTDFRVGMGLSNDEIVFLATPTKEPKSSFFASNNNIFSVISNGKCTEGGWDYINFIMDDGFLRSYLQTQGSFYTRKDSFETMLKDAQYRSNHTTWINEAGITECDYTYGNGLTDEDIEHLKNYVSSCTNFISEDFEIEGIISEEYASFNSGDISAEQCAKQIQNRISLMLSEQS